MNHCAIDARESRSLFEAETTWYLGAKLGREDEACREAAMIENDNAIARAKVSDGGAKTANNSRAFQTQSWFCPFHKPHTYQNVLKDGKISTGRALR